MNNISIEKALGNHRVSDFVQYRLYKNFHFDFELSIDKTLFTTSIEAHYLVAAELIDRGVKISSLAPRFCGEFQKGTNWLEALRVIALENPSLFREIYDFGAKHLEEAKKIMLSKPNLVISYP